MISLNYSIQNRKIIYLYANTKAWLWQMDLICWFSGHSVPKFSFTIKIKVLKCINLQITIFGFLRSFFPCLYLYVWNTPSILLGQ